MSRQPRNPRDPLLSRFVITRTIYVGVLMCAVAVALFLGVVSADGGSLTGPPLRTRP